MKKLLAVVACATGMVLSAAQIPFAENVMVHLDASDESTMTVDPVTKEVTEWRSVETSTTKFIAPAPITIAGASYETGIPYLVEENGRKAVWFGGKSKGDSPTNHLMAADGVVRNPKTVVAVVRPHLAKSYYTLFGGVTSSSTRFYRDSSVEAGWSTVNWTGSRYLNLVKDKTLFDDAGGFETPHVVTGSRTANCDIEILGGAYLWQGTKASAAEVYAHASLHELVFYNRVLTDDELMEVQLHLMAKWDVVSVSIWQGGGATTDWNDAGNWQDGEIPAEGTIVRIPSGATITATGDCQAKRILSEGATLTLAQGAAFTVREGISGLTVSGKGVVSCCGLWDLAGHDCSVAALLGNGMLTNSAAEAVTLTVDTESAAELSLYVAGPISLVKRGAGTLAVAGPQGYTGSTTVEAGKLAASPDLAYGRYGHVSAHLDASRTDLMTRDADGSILRWDSLSDNGLYFEAGETAFPEAKFQTARTYTMTDADGRKAVRFGTDQGGSFTGAFLKASMPLANQTIFCVHRPFTVYQGAIIGNVYNTNNRIIHSTNGDYNPGDGWINGVHSNACRLVGEVGGTDIPHVYAHRRDNCANCEVIGVAWPQDKGPTGDIKNPLTVYSQMDFNEMVVFDEALTDGEIAEISAALVRKWSCRPWTSHPLAPVNGWAAGSAYSIADGATVDFGAADPKAGSLGGSGTVIAGGNLSLVGSSPTLGALTLSCAGILDLGGAALTVRELKGFATTVTNTSATTARLIVDNGADDARLEARVTGDVAVEKRGTAELSVARGQSYSGETKLEGGTLKAVADVDYASFGKVVGHFDASRPETLTVDPETGHVLSWRSVEGDLVLDNALESFPDDAAIHRGYTFAVTDAVGRVGIRFGCVSPDDNTFTGSFFRASHAITNRTVFFVNRQLVKTGYGTLIGPLWNYNRRIYRNSNGSYGWTYDKGEMQTYFVSGLESTCSFETAGGIDAPHVFATCRADVSDKDWLIGRCWLRDDGPTGGIRAASSLNASMDLHEVLIYENALSAEQMKAVMDMLMRKWRLENPEGSALDLSVPTLSPNTTYHLTADTTLDFGFMPQEMKGVRLDAGTVSVYPVLTFAGVPGALDLTGSTLTLESDETIGRRQTLLRSPDATVVGPFASVEGLDPSANLKYREHDVGYSIGGILILVR